MAAILAGCGTEEPSGPGPTGEDSAGRAACSRFREVAFGAAGEELSRSQVVLREVGDLAADSTDPAIRDNGIAAAEETYVRALVSGEPDPTLDALADACDAAFPI